MSTPLNKDTAVRNLQRYLRRLSQDYPTILPIPIDGIFDEQTLLALSAFQKLFDLPVNGIADALTWNTLFDEYLRLTQNDLRLPLPDFFPSAPPNYQTQSGERHAFITLLQFMLNELQLVYDTLPLLTLSGIMDDPTSQSVSQFQKIHLLPVSGQVNRQTWNRIVQEYMHYVA